MNGLARLLPRRLATQLILTAVLALLITQSLMIPVFFNARLASVAEAVQGSTLARTANLARLLQSTPPELSDTVVSSVNSRATRVKLLPGDPGLLPTDGMLESPSLAGELIEAAEGALSTARVFIAESPHLDEPIVVTLSRLQDGRYLQTQFQLPDSPSTWTTSTILTAGLLSGLLAIAMTLLLRRMTRPLANLSSAAEALGRGQPLQQLAEEGPEDVLGTIRAFNRMQSRIQQQNEERNRALASVSHDLKTPITALRLQIELLEDEPQRDSMLTTLSEMESVTHYALDYLKSTRESETPRKVDIAALLDSACEELRLIGFEVDHEYQHRQNAQCRPKQLKRALSNLIRNAAQYGERARVSIARESEQLRILIEDDGPGIPPDQQEAVKRPFVRLESSRNRQTGGSGLGLAIANDIILSHGGCLMLSNAEKKGLTQKILIPA